MLIFFDYRLKLEIVATAMAKKPHSSRNKILAAGISRYSRSAMYRKKALYKKNKIPGKAPVKKRTYFSIKPIKGEKNGEKRVVLKSKAVSFFCCFCF